MKVDELDVPGAWMFTPAQHPDDRGLFLEWFKADALREATGIRFALAQANNSVSRTGVLRGIHFAQVPPGQAKYLYCPQGALMDFVVDIRVGSPTYRQWCAVRLDDVERRALYLAEGLGHAFVALTDDASLTYLCSTPYNPGREHTVNPLDADLAIDWGVAEPLLSPRDAAAPSLAEAEQAGLLPQWDECQAWYAELRALA